MAYPFVQMPTIDEFINRARADYGCTFRPGAITLFGPDGKSQLSTLSCEVDDETRSVALPFGGHGKRLTPHVLRSLCDRLGIPLEDFGLALSDDGLSSVDP